jgi:hypothetical protein
MHLPASRKRNRLPKKFPVGATYVVEGRGGETGHLRVFSRYVVLPNGERINLGGDVARPVRSRARRSRNRSESRVSGPGGTRSARPKKIIAAAGTSGRGRR